MAGRQLDGSVGSVLYNFDGGRHLAVGQHHLQHCGRAFNCYVADQFDLHVQPMILHFFGNLAIEVRFQAAALFTFRIVVIERLFDLLLVIGGEPVERCVQAGQNFGFVIDTAQIGMIDGVAPGIFGQPHQICHRRQFGGQHMAFFVALQWGRLPLGEQLRQVDRSRRDSLTSTQVAGQRQAHPIFIDNNRV